MKKLINFLLFVLITISLVQAFGGFPHAFQGTAKYEDETDVPDGIIVTAKLNGIFPTQASCVVNNGKYGYEPDTLIITDDLNQGGTITFYIDGVEANEQYPYEPMAKTELDLTVEESGEGPYCGDGSCNAGECDEGCALDCDVEDCINENCDLGIDDCLNNPEECGECCIEEWNCTEWSACSDGTQTMTCIDNSACGTIEDKPTESQSCGDPEPTSPSSPGGCFLAGTKILTKNGYKTIEKIDIGEEVIAYDESTKTQKLGKITKTFSHENVPEYLVINDKLRVTPNHPIFVNGEWETASKIKRGDKLLKKNGDLVTVKNIKVFADKVTVYNLEVEDYHTYYAEDYLVHNKGGSPPTPAKDNKTEECTEDWACNPWSDCVNGEQTRDCWDWEACGTTNSKLDETKSCQEETLSNLVVGEEGNDNNVFNSEGNIYQTNLGTGQAVGIFDRVKSNWLPIILALGVVVLLALIGWKGRNVFSKRKSKKVNIKIKKKK